MPEAAVVGAGLVGCLTAFGLAKRGWTVTLYERRPDPRQDRFESDRLRSINLALSARGIVAIQSVDPALAERILREVIPMRGRMIHSTDGRESSQAYSADGLVRRVHRCLCDRRHCAVACSDLLGYPALTCQGH